MTRLDLLAWYLLDSTTAFYDFLDEIAVQIIH